MVELGYWASEFEVSSRDSFFPGKLQVESGASEAALSVIATGMKVAARSGAQTVSVLCNTSCFLKIAFEPSGCDVRVCRLTFKMEVCREGVSNLVALVVVVVTIIINL